MLIKIFIVLIVYIIFRKYQIYFQSNFIADRGCWSFPHMVLYLKLKWS